MYMERGKNEKFEFSQKYLPTFPSCVKNFGERVHFEPNLFCASVMFSLVWESKEGFTMRQLIKIHMWFRI